MEEPQEIAEDPYTAKPGALILDTGVYDLGYGERC